MEKVFNIKVLGYIFAFFAGVLSVYVMIGLNKSHIISDLEYANYKTLDYKENLLNAYYKYYNSAEAMFDILQIEDSPIIETDEGSKYLKANQVVKSLQDEEANCDKY